MAIVDWDAASAVGVRMVASGPSVSPAYAAEAVDELGSLAAMAVQPVRQTTGLVADSALHRTEVVDRAEWIRSSVAGMKLLLEPLETRVAARQGPGWAAAATGRIAALEVGAAMSWVATKVLGQYEALTQPEQPGRLLLVAPNIVAAESELSVPARDFRMWVALHEETHRVQFGAVGWLEDYFRSEVGDFLGQVDVSNAEALKKLGAVSAAVLRVLAGAPGSAIVDAMQTQGQRAVFARLTAFMSLLEGHAEYVMDAVGPQVVPALDEIREKFDERRRRPSARDGLIRRLLGMDVKLQQYTQGRRFVAQVVDAVGMAEFNRVWESPQTLPRPAEIAEPGDWIRRVLG
jgi:coenzyme F420 biosynthesis associated uncharacterized protein